jgi:arsenate reductase (thioredoxin)
MVPDGGDPRNARGGVRGGRYRLLGPRVPRTASAHQPPGAPARPPNPQPASTAAKKRVLFVCIGNSCRSQMAEAFARAYGSDVLEARSAGLNPATVISPLTRQILAEHNLSIDDHFPKGMELAAKEHYDVLVNMSGTRVSLPGAQVFNWPVEDPIGKSDAVYRTVAGQIERLVMRLVLDFRNSQ